MLIFNSYPSFHFLHRGKLLNSKEFSSLNKHLWGTLLCLTRYKKYQTTIFISFKHLFLHAELHAKHYQFSGSFWMAVLCQLYIVTACLSVFGWLSVFTNTSCFTKQYIKLLIPPLKRFPFYIIEVYCNLSMSFLDGLAASKFFQSPLP